MNGRKIAPVRSFLAASRRSEIRTGLNQFRDQRKSQAPRAKSMPVISPVPSAAQRLGTWLLSCLKMAPAPQSNPNAAPNIRAVANLRVQDRSGLGKSEAFTVRGAAGTPAT